MVAATATNGSAWGPANYGTSQDNKQVRKQSLADMVQASANLNDLTTCQSMLGKPMWREESNALVSIDTAMNK